MKPIIEQAKERLATERLTTLSHDRFLITELVKELEQSPQAEQATASSLRELLCVADGEPKPYGVTDSCDQCDFCMEADAGGAIGAMLMSRGTYQYCEKGYWKEDT